MLLVSLSQLEYPPAIHALTSRPSDSIEKWIRRRVVNNVINILMGPMGHSSDLSQVWNEHCVLDLLEHELLSLAFGRADYDFSIQRTETVELSDAITHARCVVSAWDQQVLSAKRR